MILRFLLLTLLCTSYSALAEWDPQVTTEYRSFKDDGLDYTKEESLAFDLAIIGEQDFFDAFYLKADLMQRFDTIQEERNVFIPKEFYLGFHNLPQLKLGWQIFNYSALEYFHPANQLNAANFDSSVESFENLGEFALSYEKYLGDSVIRFHLLPLFQKHLYPERNVRTGFGANIDGPVIVDGGQKRKSDIIPQVAFDFSTVIDRLDWGFQAGRVVSKQTVRFAFTNALPGTQSAQPLQFWKNYISTSFTYAWSEWLFKGEASFNDFDSEKISIPLTANYPIVGIQTLGADYSSPRDHTNAAIGVERRVGLWGRSELTLYLEHQKLLGLENTTATKYNIFQNDLFLGAKLSLNDVRDTYFQVFWIKDVSGIDEYMLTAKMSRRLYGNLRFNLGGVIIDSSAPETNVNSLAPYRAIDYAYLNTTYYF